MQPLYYFNIKPQIDTSEGITLKKKNEVKESSTPCFLGSPCNEDLINILNTKEQSEK
jgi:hypothetical protein